MGASTGECAFKMHVCRKRLHSHVHCSTDLFKRANNSANCVRAVPLIPSTWETNKHNKLPNVHSGHLMFRTLLASCYSWVCSWARIATRVSPATLPLCTQYDPWLRIRLFAEHPQNQYPVGFSTPCAWNKLQPVHERYHDQRLCSNDKILEA